MSISCQALYDDAKSTYGVGAGSDLFQGRWVRAINRALDELSIAADLETKHSHISGPEDNITSLADYYEWILVAGMNYYMARVGQRPSDPNVLKMVYADTQNQWERGKNEYVANRWNEKQANDSTEDIIGLGYLGS